MESANFSNYHTYTYNGREMQIGQKLQEWMLARANNMRHYNLLSTCAKVWKTKILHFKPTKPKSKLYFQRHSLEMYGSTRASHHKKPKGTWCCHYMDLSSSTIWQNIVQSRNYKPLWLYKLIRITSKYRYKILTYLGKLRGCPLTQDF